MVQFVDNAPDPLNVSVAGYVPANAEDAIAGRQQASTRRNALHNWRRPEVFAVLRGPFGFRNSSLDVLPEGAAT